MEQGSDNKDNTSVSKFYVNNKPLYAEILWKDDDCDLFHIKVLYEDSSWFGKYSNEFAAKRRERLDESVDEYNTNVKECLSGDSRDYVYDLIQNAEDESKASFIWKKRYESALKMHGSVPLLREAVPTSKDTLIDILLKKNKQYNADIEMANKVYNNLQQELKQYKHKLEELIESKSSLECNLYGQFVQILNKKKERIQMLEEHINSL